MVSVVLLQPLLYLADHYVECFNYSNKHANTKLLQYIMVMKYGRGFQSSEWPDVNLCE